MAPARERKAERSPARGGSRTAPKYALQGHKNSRLRERAGKRRAECGSAAPPRVKAALSVGSNHPMASSVPSVKQSLPDGTDGKNLWVQEAEGEKLFPGDSTFSSTAQTTRQISTQQAGGGHLPLPYGALSLSGRLAVHGGANLPSELPALPHSHVHGRPLHPNVHCCPALRPVGGTPAENLLVNSGRPLVGDGRSDEWVIRFRSRVVPFPVRPFFSR